MVLQNVKKNIFTEKKSRFFDKIKDVKFIIFKFLSKFTIEPVLEH